MLRDYKLLDWTGVFGDIVNMSSMQDPNSCESLHRRLIGQLDTLVPFLALTHREIFDVLSKKYTGWYSADQQATLPDSYESYSCQVSHAAFLLGYSYAEAFVTDLMWLVYSKRKDLLPEDKTIKYADVLSRADFENIVRHMIDCTLADMNSLEKKILHLEKRFGLEVQQPDLMREAHIARNALVHNAGRVNRDDAASTNWRVGDKVTLSASDVHNFGIMARSYTREMYMKAQAICSAKVI